MLAELIDAHGAVEVLEPVLAQVAERLRAEEERRRRRREEDLVAVRKRGDARAAVDVLADIALCGRCRSARVQAHAHADRARLEALARRLRGLRCSSGRGKRDEERVALGVDLDTAVRRRRLAHDPPVLGERVGVARRPERVEQACRPLDVGEEQRDRALRKLAHGQMMTTPELRRTSARAGSRRTPPSRPQAPRSGRSPSQPGMGRRGSWPAPWLLARCRTR